MSRKKSKFCSQFTQRLKKIRKEREISQAELGDRLGFASHVPVSRLERGVRYPDAEELLWITQTLQVDLHWLITGELSMNTKRIISLLKPYVYAHLQALTKELENLETERRELESSVDQDAAIQRLKEVNKTIEGLHYYYKTVLETLNEKLPKLTGDDPTV